MISLFPLNNFFTRLHEQRKSIKRRNRPKRTVARFKERYANYIIGKNCYGTPIIKSPLPQSELEIGSYCSIAGNVQIFLGGIHRTDYISTYPFPAFFKEAEHIKEFEVTRGKVLIGSDVWLCENCTILSGITIGHGAVVANGALVTKNVEPYEIVGGNPAKHIRWRFDEPTRQTLLELAWWDWPEEEILSITHLLCSEEISPLLAYAKNRKMPI